MLIKLSTRGVKIIVRECRRERIGRTSEISNEVEGEVLAEPEVLVFQQSGTICHLLFHG